MQMFNIPLTILSGNCGTHQTKKMICLTLVCLITRNLRPWKRTLMNGMQGRPQWSIYNLFCLILHIGICFTCSTVPSDTNDYLSKNCMHTFICQTLLQSSSTCFFQHLHFNLCTILCLFSIYRRRFQQMLWAVLYYWLQLFYGFIFVGSDKTQAKQLCAINQGIWFHNVES